MTGKLRLALVAACVSAVAGAVENPYGICAHLHAADAKSDRDGVWYAPLTESC